MAGAETKNIELEQDESDQAVKKKWDSIFISHNEVDFGRSIKTRCFPSWKMLVVAWSQLL